MRASFPPSGSARAVSGSDLGHSGLFAVAGVLPLVAERAMGTAYELLGPILLKSSR